MKPAATAILCALAALILASCAHIPSYRIPLNERSRVFACDASSTLEAVQQAFPDRGFEISHVDSETGAVYTKFRILDSSSSEVGGTVRAQWTAMVETIPAGSLVSVQYLLETRSAALWADRPVEINKAHGIYVQVFRDVETILSGLDKR